jgi:putative Mg2+ transporter-C (MgtC) family protein
LLLFRLPFQEPTITTSLYSPETLDAALRLGSAVAIGGLVGFDRGLRQKPAGLRTHALVSLGAALMTITGMEIAPEDPGAITRVLQGVIAGVGFLGGGVILRDNHDQRVRGLTTAASIWIVAGLGMACGAGHWRTGLLASGFTLVVLMAGRRIEQILAAPLAGHLVDAAPTPPQGMRMRKARLGGMRSSIAG